MKRKRRSRIAFLGWGSLLWEGGEVFDQQHGRWWPQGPTVPIEFSRVSASRLGALTLVVDPDHGTLTTVAWCLSKRSTLEDAVCDLRSREGTTKSNIATIQVGTFSSGDAVAAGIAAWVRRRKLDSVVWTALPSNFSEKTGSAFSVGAALAYIQDGLSAEGKAKAAEYVWRAPAFVHTPLRNALQQEPWFGNPAT